MRMSHNDGRKLWFSLPSSVRMLLLNGLCTPHVSIVVALLPLKAVSTLPHPQRHFLNRGSSVHPGISPPEPRDRSTAPSKTNACTAHSLVNISALQEQLYSWGNAGPGDKVAPDHAGTAFCGDEAAPAGLNFFSSL
jgi:hypothetical protein